MSKSFADLGISDAVVKALSARGITAPFPVQRLVTEDVLDRNDVLVQSPTGSGKTLAFGIPLVERLDSDGFRPQALILAPTRELATQIRDELDSICHARALKITAVYGGVGINPQMKAVRKSHVVVATPGRLEDLIQRRAIDLSKVRVLVLDEADRMLDMGFKPAVDRIVGLLPQKRQTLFFSATLEGAAGKLAEEYTYKARTHTHAPEPQKKADISHRFVQFGSQAAKFDELLNVIQRADGERTLVFVRTKRGADRLAKKLNNDGAKVAAMHGDRTQSQRRNALDRFDRGKLDALIATDVAARGIDVAEVGHVVNYDLPEDAETYTHRVGRTGRAGATGDAHTFVISDQIGEMRKMAKTLGLLDQLDKGVGRGAGPNYNGGGSGSGSSKPKHSFKGQGKKRRGQGKNHGAPKRGGSGGPKSGGQAQGSGSRSHKSQGGQGGSQDGQGQGSQGGHRKSKSSSKRSHSGGPKSGGGQNRGRHSGRSHGGQGQGGGGQGRGGKGRKQSQRSARG